MDPRRDDHDEILRLRDRVHELEGTIIGLTLRFGVLERWQRHASRKLEDLVRADELADAVAERIKKERTVALTFGQKAAAFVVGAVAVAGGIKGLWG